MTKTKLKAIDGGKKKKVVQVDPTNIELKFTTSSKTALESGKVDQEMIKELQKLFINFSAAVTIIGKRYDFDLTGLAVFDLK